jgi:parallel beta-helix repeat protein
MGKKEFMINKLLAQFCTVLILLTSISALGIKLNDEDHDIVNSTSDILFLSDTIIVPDDYPTIQAAIDNADTGDAVFVKRGIYYENIIIDKSILLLGENRNTTIIDGSAINDVIYVSAESVYILNFTVQNGGNNHFEDANIDVRSNYSCILYNIIRSNSWNGILLKKTNYNNITNNFVINISNNAIWLWESNNNIVSNNIIQNSSWNGLWLYENSHNNLISNNTISETVSGIDIWDHNDCNKIFSNLIKNCKGVMGSGLVIKASSTVILNNILSDNTYGIRLLWGSSNTFISNSIKNNYWGVYFEPLYGITNQITFKKNNFINNNIDVDFNYVSYEIFLLPRFYLNLLSIKWNDNYWDNRVYLLPKIIIGEIIIRESREFSPGLTRSAVIVDWNPAKEPFIID